jgi:hypothetical protein
LLQLQASLLIKFEDICTSSCKLGKDMHCEGRAVRST